MSRADEPTTLPDGDDEITTDVDPSWVASIRADTNGSATSHSRGQADPADGDDVDDWVLAEPRWDPEATVGVSDGLIERIRQEVRATPTRPVTSAAPNTTTVPATTTATTSAVPAHDVTPAPSVDVPPAAPARPAPPPPILEQPRPAASATGRFRPRGDRPPSERPLRSRRLGRASRTWPRPPCGGSRVSASPPPLRSPTRCSSRRRRTTVSTGPRS